MVWRPKVLRCKVWRRKVWRCKVWRRKVWRRKVWRCKVYGIIYAQSSCLLWLTFVRHAWHSQHHLWITRLCRAYRGQLCAIFEPVEMFPCTPAPTPKPLQTAHPHNGLQWLARKKSRKNKSDYSSRASTNCLCWVPLWHDMGSCFSFMSDSEVMASLRCAKCWKWESTPHLFNKRENQVVVWMQVRHDDQPWYPKETIES